MNRWSALASLVILAGAFVLRLTDLGIRPLHNDEAVNAFKVAELWQDGRYVYDPDEYHGPTLHYATLPFLGLSGARNTGELNDALLRVVPVVFGVGLILLLLLLVDGLGRPATVWAAVFTAVSPAMVFYSRYFIHEMLLVFFTALTIGAGWRYVQTRSASWVLVAGLGLGLMVATKETFVLAFMAMGLAGIVTVWWTLPKNPSLLVIPPSGGPNASLSVGDGINPGLQTGWRTDEGFHIPHSNFRQFLVLIHFRYRNSLLPKNTRMIELRSLWNGKHAALAVGAALVVWLVLFSSFFSNAAGLADSVRTYLPWLKRAGGSSPHIHPWYFYLERLAWFHPAKSPVWSEALILALAVVGAGVSLVGKKTPLPCFFALYTIILTGVYSVISYKTPWCLLGFLYGMIILAGVGAVAVLESCRSRALKFITATILCVLTLQLSWQAWRANSVYPADPRNPYVYAQTSPDFFQLVQRIEGIAKVAPRGVDTVVKIIAPENDYWPLPWSLRQFRQLGWYDHLPEDPFAPIMVVSSKFDARLDDKSDRKWIMAGITQMRPGTFFELYVELELWKTYVATLPRERD